MSSPNPADATKQRRCWESIQLWSNHLNPKTSRRGIEHLRWLSEPRSFWLSKGYRRGPMTPRTMKATRRGSEDCRWRSEHWRHPEEVPNAYRWRSESWRRWHFDKANGLLHYSNLSTAYGQLWFNIQESRGYLCWLPKSLPCNVLYCEDIHSALLASWKYTDIQDHRGHELRCPTVAWRIYVNMRWFRLWDLYILKISIPCRPIVAWHDIALRWWRHGPVEYIDEDARRPVFGNFSKQMTLVMYSSGFP